ncbi:MAG: DNA-formamidopyrimidine glycosylase family protein [Polyangiaceae bacterium]
MPELPDVTVYIERMSALLTGRALKGFRCPSPFLVRTFDPPTRELVGKRVLGFRRLGKRIVWQFEGDLWLVLHLMIAGRLRWAAPGAPIQKKLGLAAFDFEYGTLMLTEAGTKKRASLHLVRGESALAAHDRGGVEPLEIDLEQFREALLRENRTLKRALTDPRIFSGIGNAYSDEILFHAQLSPVQRTGQLKPEHIEKLFEAVGSTLELWTQRLRDEVGDGFPDRVTAFREEMAVHGRYKQPCPVCGTAVQRIRHADNEVNYCPRCQTAGKLLADRSLSRLLKADWPRSIDELEDRQEEIAKQREPAPPASKAKTRPRAAADKPLAAPLKTAKQAVKKLPKGPAKKAGSKTRSA